MNFSLQMLTICARHTWDAPNNERQLYNEIKGKNLEKSSLKVWHMIFSQKRMQVSLRYGKILKISPGACIFQRPFLRGLFLEGLIFEGAYVQREICVSKSIGLACSGKETYHFCFVLRCIRGQIPSTSPPRGLIFEGAI